MAQKCFRYFVAGKVQGVWYRAHTQQQAQQLGVTGWVKNLPDGRVEVLACGDEQQLKALQEWLWQGPPRAQVNAVTLTELGCDEYSDFQIIK